MIVFAAGNKYKIDTNTLKFDEYHNSWYAYGIRWIKSKNAWAGVKSRGLIVLGKHYEEIKEE